MDTKERGDISEYKAITRLLELGVDVFTPATDNTRADLIYQDSTGLNRVQVKTAWRRESSIVFNTAKVNSNSTSHKRTQYDGEIECFIIYSPDMDTLYYLDVDDAGNSSKWLMVEEPGKHTPESNVNWHEDYLLNKHVQPS